VMILYDLAMRAPGSIISPVHFDKFAPIESRAQTWNSFIHRAARSGEIGRAEVDRCISSG